MNDSAAQEERSRLASVLVLAVVAIVTILVGYYSAGFSFVNAVIVSLAPWAVGVAVAVLLGSFKADVIYVVFVAAITNLAFLLHTS